MYHSIRQAGFSLMEVLVAWFILSMAAVSLILLQNELVRHNRHAYLQSVAILELTNFLEQLRANYSSSFRARELSQWNQYNQKLLPQGKGDYSCQAQQCQVHLRWQESQQQQMSLSSIL